MHNQLIEARKGNITAEMRTVAERGRGGGTALRDLIAEGKAIIMHNERHRDLTPKGVGKGLSIKVNANLGTSPERIDIEEEMEKLKMAMEAGADTIMDLSTGGDLDEIRKTVMAIPDTDRHGADLPGSGGSDQEEADHHEDGPRGAFRGD